MTGRRSYKGNTLANLIMCGLSCIMSVAAMAISFDTLRMCRWLNRRLNEKQAKLDEAERRLRIR